MSSETVVFRSLLKANESHASLQRELDVKNALDSHAAALTARR
jgi:hypothetical protein